MADIVVLTSAIHLDDTQNSVSKLNESIINEDDRGKQKKWILTMLNLFRGYKMNTFVPLHLLLLF